MHIWGENDANGPKITKIHNSLIKPGIFCGFLLPSLQTIPPELGKLKYLEQLDLSWNGLNGIFPEEIFDVTSLVNLNVGYQWNDWNCTRSDGRLVEIMYIMGDSENDVNYGLYGSIIDSRIGQLQNLRELTIAENSFSGQIGKKDIELK